MTKLLRFDITFDIPGDTVERVAKDDPGYLRWILSNMEDISEEDRDIIEAALTFRNRR